MIRTELAEVAEKYKDKRRTKIGGAGGEDVEFDAEAFIVDEDVTVILSRDGWLKRVREVKDISATRLREGDAVLAALRGSTKEAIAIFSNLGSCYVTRVNDVPASTGYGEPVQKLFNFRDGERAVGALVLDQTGAPKGAVALAVTRQGYGLRFNLDVHRELSTRAGRRFAKLAEGDEIVGVSVAGPDEVVCVVTTEARALVCRVEEIPELANPGRGVIVIKVAADDPVVGFGVGRAARQGVADRRDRRRQEDPHGHGPSVADRARRQGPPAGAQGQGRARDPPRAAPHPHAAQLAQNEPKIWPAPLTRQSTSRSSKGWSRCAGGPACTSAAPTPRAITTCCGRSSTTRSTR